VASKPDIRLFSVAKRGNAPAENEDRAFVRDKRSLLVGLADGATEAALSREWADALVHSRWKSTLLDKYEIASAEVAPNVVDEWLSPTRECFTEMHASTERPWFAREKIRKGAHATLLVFRLFDGGKWKAAACGDACLLQVAGTSIEESFPISSVEEFTNTPELVSSLPGAPSPRLWVCTGQRHKDQTHFVLATDALAAWLLEPRYGPANLAKLLQCETDDAFSSLIEGERKLGSIRNDDTTAVVIAL
jgi:hypothetical protein